MHLAPLNELKSLSSPWTLTWWGVDLLGSFPTTVGQAKYLIVGVDYFTKWIEAKPLAKLPQKSYFVSSNETSLLGSVFPTQWL
jgi:hypothetical protein